VGFHEDAEPLCFLGDDLGKLHPQPVLQHGPHHGAFHFDGRERAGRMNSQAHVGPRRDLRVRLDQTARNREIDSRALRFFVLLLRSRRVERHETASRNPIVFAPGACAVPPEKGQEAVRAELAAEGIHREKAQEPLESAPLRSLLYQPGLASGARRHPPSLTDCAARGKATRFQVVS
jgi:hypothetical protein